MGTHTIHRTSVPTTRSGGEYGRQLFTTVGGAALVVSAFLNWSRDMTGITLSNHSLIRTEFLSQTDVVRTVGGIAVAIGLVGMFGLVDRSGWLTRLCGLLGIALFVMFAIEVYRSSAHTLQVGAWLALAGGIVMLIGGFMRGAEIVTERMEFEERQVDPGDTRMMNPGAEPRGYGYGSHTTPDTRSRDADIAAENAAADNDIESEPRGGRA